MTTTNIKLLIDAAEAMDRINTGREGVIRDRVKNRMNIVHQSVFRERVKAELREKIQAKRLNQGLGELKIVLSDKPYYKPKEEDVVKQNMRRQRNREAARKCRWKKKTTLDQLSRELQQLKEENYFLKEKIQSLEMIKNSFICDEPCVHTCQIIYM